MLVKACSSSTAAHRCLQPPVHNPRPTNATGCSPGNADPAAPGPPWLPRRAGVRLGEAGGHPWELCGFETREAVGARADPPQQTPAVSSLSDADLCLWARPALPFRVHGTPRLQRCSGPSRPGWTPWHLRPARASRAPRRQGPSWRSAGGPARAPRRLRTAWTPRTEGPSRRERPAWLQG